jgi:hypothetical protein
MDLLVPFSRMNESEQVRLTPDGLYTISLLRGMIMSEQSTSAPVPEQVEYRDLAVLGLPGYRVGSDGSVWTSKSGGSHRRHAGTWRLKALWKTGKGYLQVSLQDINLHPVPLPFLVHRLVLSAFVGPCPEGCITRHLDDDRTNNHLTNLRWGTQVENVQDARRNGRRHSKVSEQDVLEIRRRASSGESKRKLASSFNLSYKHLCKIARGANWPALEENP